MLSLVRFQLCEPALRNGPADFVGRASRGGVQIRQRKLAFLRTHGACRRAHLIFWTGRNLEYRHKSWHNRVWGAKALAAAGKGAEAIRCAEDSKGLNAPLTAIAAFCEGVLLDAGFADEAYARYAVEATYATTNLTTFKAIAKKYPVKPTETILRDLIASQLGNEGNWFAAAKDACFFELAIELANRSPSDPRTLIRAARDFAVERPAFALAAGMTALRGIANGWGYGLTGVDVLDAYAAVMAAAGAAVVDEAVVKADVRELISASPSGGQLVGRMLSRQLTD